MQIHICFVHLFTRSSAALEYLRKPFVYFKERLNNQGMYASSKRAGVKGKYRKVDQGLRDTIFPPLALNAVSWVSSVCPQNFLEQQGSTSSKISPCLQTVYTLGLHPLGCSEIAILRAQGHNLHLQGEQQIESSRYLMLSNIQYPPKSFQSTMYVMLPKELSNKNLYDYLYMILKLRHSVSEPECFYFATSKLWWFSHATSLAFGSLLPSFMEM